MYRLAILGALLTLLVAGCGGGGGGSGDDGSGPSAAAVAEAPAAGAASETEDEPADAKTKQDAKKKPAKKPAANERKQAEPKLKREDVDTEEELEQAIEEADANPRNRLIRTAAQAAVLRFGLKFAGVDIRDGGRDITVLVTRKSACNGAAKDEANMVVLIREAAPVVKSVRFEVAGTGKQFGYYVLGCKQPKMPDGPGRVVFEHTGVSGPYTSPRFKITTKKWALEWENAGSSMACIVMPVGGESEGEYFEPVGERKKGAGRNVYTGKGTFQLKIHGAALWSVRIKEIR